MADDTGIPIGKIQAQEKDRLLGIETKLHERVKGQDKAIRTLQMLSSSHEVVWVTQRSLSVHSSSSVQLVRVRQSWQNRWPTFLFDDDTAMIRFDMSEFKEEHSAAYCMVLLQDM